MRSWSYSDHLSPERSTMRSRNVSRRIEFSDNEPFARERTRIDDSKPRNRVSDSRSVEIEGGRKPRVSGTRLSYIVSSDGVGNPNLGVPTSFTWEDLDQMAELYPWPKGVTLCLPVEAGGSLAKYANSVVVHEESLKAGFRLPLAGYSRDLLSRTELCPAQFNPNSWRLISAYGIRCWEMGLEPSFRGMQCWFEMREVGDVFCLSSRVIDLVLNPRDVSNWKRKWFLVTKGEGFDFNFPIHPGRGLTLNPGRSLRYKNGGDANELLGEAKELKDALQSLGEGLIKVKYSELITRENLEKAGLSLPRPTTRVAGMKSGQSLLKSETGEQAKGSHSSPSKSEGASKKQTIESRPPPEEEEERPAKKRVETAHMLAKGSHSPPSKSEVASKKQTTESRPPPEKEEERPAKKRVETAHVQAKGSHSPPSKIEGASKKQTTESRPPPGKEEERPAKKRVETAHVQAKGSHSPPSNSEGFSKKQTTESHPPPVKEEVRPAKKRVETAHVQANGSYSPPSKGEGASKKQTIESHSPPGKEEERATKPGSPIAQQCRDRTQLPKSESIKDSSPVRPSTKSPTHQPMRSSSRKPSLATEAPHFSKGRHGPPPLQSHHDYLVTNPTLEEAKGLLSGATVNANAVYTLGCLPDEQVSAEFARATALQIYHANNLIKKYDKLLLSYLGSRTKLEELKEKFQKEEEELKHELSRARKSAKQNEETSKKEIQSLKNDLKKTQEEKASLGFQARGMQKANEKLQRQVEEQHQKIQELERALSRLKRQRT